MRFYYNRRQQRSHQNKQPQIASQWIIGRKKLRSRVATNLSCRKFEGDGQKSPGYPNQPTSFGGEAFYYSWKQQPSLQKDTYA